MMSRRTTGTIFIMISAFLYGVRYLSAAIFGSGLNSWDENLFDLMLNAIGNGPLIASIVALIIGIVFLIWAESKGIKKVLAAIDKQTIENQNDSKSE